ncbi:hypothetical protein SLA2020_439110 [Shorea laevis]
MPLNLDRLGQDLNPTKLDAPTILPTIFASFMSGKPGYPHVFVPLDPQNGYYRPQARLVATHEGWRRSATYRQNLAPSEAESPAYRRRSPFSHLPSLH